MVSLALAEEYREAGLHERTGYPLLPEVERVIDVLGGFPRTCASCWWCKGSYWGAPFASGNSSQYMDARCERRFVELRDMDTERTEECGNGFGPGYTRDHREDAPCGGGRMEDRSVGRPEYPAADRERCLRWRNLHAPRLGVGNRRPDHPACAYWRARGPEMAKLKRGEAPADIADLWAEFDAAATVAC